MPRSAAACCATLLLCITGLARAEPADDALPLSAGPGPAPAAPPSSAPQPSPLAAVFPPGPYLGAGVAAQYLQRTASHLSSGGSLRGHYDLGYRVHYEAGWAFANGLRPEIEFGTQRNTLRPVTLGSGFGRLAGSRVDTGGAIYAFDLMTNLWYDTPSPTPWLRPYLGGGAGVVELWQKDVNLPGTALGTHATSFAWQLGTGLSFRVARPLVVSADYRYFAATSARYHGGVANLASSYRAHQLGVSFRWVFGLGAGTQVVAAGGVIAPSPRDSDHDGVPDYRDECPTTPEGVTVDSRGCPVDSDSDGVPDYLDRCLNTPPGVPVDGAGCPRDSDHDGVPDYLDQCPNTPPNTPVDEHGCPLDSDHDGVPDSLDQCPGTAPGVRVMANGCAVNQTFVLRGVNFEFAKARLTPDSGAVLDQTAQTLIASADFRVEIAGYTDSVGSAARNLRLSRARAETVRAYLMSKGVPPRQLIAHGYGKADPVASNDTDAGRAQNRRVELHPLAGVAQQPARARVSRGRHKKGR